MSGFHNIWVVVLKCCYSLKFYFAALKGAIEVKGFYHNHGIIKITLPLEIDNQF